MIRDRVMLFSVRLQRGVDVAGIEPELARRLARACWSGPSTDEVAHRVGIDVDEARSALEKLETAGFVERSVREWRDESWTEWALTVSGGALSMASFLKPITRRKAETLLSGVLERAQVYNDCPDKPLWIERIALFGSLLDEDATDFGDVDLQVVLADRPSKDPIHARLDYAGDSQRSFASFVERLAWAETEVRRLLASRSGYIKVHTEDISKFTDRWRLIFERSTWRNAQSRTGLSGGTSPCPVWLWGRIS